MSLTIKAFIALCIFKLLSWAGFEALEGDITSFILIGGQIISAILIWHGRFRQGDITFYGAKK